MMRRREDFTDYYQVLGVAPGADYIQIRHAFLSKAKQNHPDVGGSAETMLVINEAYKTLILPASKAAYDLLHSFHTGTKEVSYHKVDVPSGHEPSTGPLSDSYIDWFLDTVYNEYSNTKKPPLSLGKRVKKAFGEFF